MASVHPHFLNNLKLTFCLLSDLDLVVFLPVSCPHSLDFHLSVRCIDTTCPPLFACLCVCPSPRLPEINSIKQAREQQVAQARRQAMPVVGDMRPLADALPELSQLLTPTARTLTARHKNRKNRV